MEIKLDWNTLTVLYNARTKHAEDLEDLTNIKFVVSYLEKTRKVEALKKFTNSIGKYIKLEMYAIGSFVDLTSMPEDIREKISKSKNRIKDVDSYIDEQFLPAEDIGNNIDNRL